MTIMLAALGVMSLWGLGFAVTPILSHLNGPQRTGVAFGVGLVWVSSAMAAASLIGIPLTRVAGLAAVVGPLAGWWLARWWREPRSPGTRALRRVMVLPRDPMWWAGAAAVGLLWLIVTARAVIKPIQYWDAWATYAFKAKVILLEAAIPPPARFAWGSGANYPDYPLGVSLQEVWVSWFVGAWDDVAVKLLFPGYLLALLFVAYGSLRERWNARMAMLGTVFVGGLPLLLQHGHDGYTNLPFAYFVFGGAVALTRYVRFADRRDVIVAAVFAAGLVWTRVDGVIVVACNAALLLVLAVRRSEGFHAARTDVAMYLSLPVLIWSAWSLAKLSFGVTATFQVDGSATVAFFERWMRIAAVFFRAFFLDGNWLILWAMVVLAAAYRWREIMRLDSLFLFWPVIVYLGSVALLFATTGLFRFLEDGTVLHRLILHMAPVAALWVAHVFGRQWGPERAGHAGVRSDTRLEQGTEAG